MKTLISSRWHRIATVPLAVLLMGAGLLFSGPVLAQTIVGTKHDFSGQLGWTEQNGEICVVCHTPHNSYSEGEAGAGVGELGPLWNRALTAVSTYDLYDSTTRVGSFINATMAAPTGVSKLCLSCHDGTIAIDSFGRDDNGAPFVSSGAPDYVGDINANANIGGGTPGGTSSDLSNDHPVSFVYADSVAGDTEIIAAAGGLPLFGGNLECATCHDVHATESVPDTKLLRVDNAGSLLCLTCHDK